MIDSPNIDALDARILAALQTHARQTNRALAEAVGVATSTALERVRLLEKRGVIRGYHADVAPAALGGHLQAMVTIRLQPKSQEIIEAALEHLWALDEVISINLVTGVDDLMVRIIARDADHLRTTIVDGITTIEGISEERTSLLFDVRHKHAFSVLATD